MRYSGPETANRQPNTPAGGDEAGVAGVGVSPAISGEPAAANEILPGLLLAGGVLLATVVLLRHYVRTNKKRRMLESKESQDPTDRLERIRERAVGSREPIERAVAEGEELTRRMAAILDTKAARLEELIRQADERLLALRGVGVLGDDLGDVDAQEDELRTVLDELASTPGPSQYRSERAAQQIPGTAGRVDPGVLGRARLDRLKQERAGGKRAGDPPSAADWREQAETLARTGVPAEEIARRVNRPVGQVELVLNLRK